MKNCSAVVILSRNELEGWRRPGRHPDDGKRENVLGDFNVNYNFMFGNYVFHI